MRLRQLVLAALLLAAALIAVQGALAQEVGAGITGVVSDPTSNYAMSGVKADWFSRTGRPRPQNGLAKYTKGRTPGTSARPFCVYSSGSIRIGTSS
jgi:hypothetical protein